MQFMAAETTAIAMAYRWQLLKATALYLGLNPAFGNCRSIHNQTGFLLISQQVMYRLQLVPRPGQVPLLSCHHADQDLPWSQSKPEPQLNEFSKSSTSLLPVKQDMNGSVCPMINCSFYNIPALQPNPDISGIGVCHWGHCKATSC